MLTYLNVDFQDKVYDLQGDGPEFDYGVWMDHREELCLDFPNLPYYIDGPTKLTESGAISTTPSCSE